MNLDVYKMDGTTQEITLYAEQQVLGSIMIDPDCLKVVKEIIRPAYFYSEWHRTIYESMLQVNHPDQLTVGQKLQEQGKLADGMLPEMSYMIANCMTSMDHKYYAEAVRRFAGARLIDYYNKRNEPDKAKSILDRLYTPQKASTIKMPTPDPLAYPGNCPTCQEDNWGMLPNGKGYYCTKCEPKRGLSQDPDDYGG